MAQTLFNHIRSSLRDICPDEEAVAISRWLLEELFGISRTDICMGKDRQLSEKERQNLENILVRLHNYEPLQYVLGFSDFCGLRFKVNRHVLIPRPETTELVETILSDFPTPPKRVLDIGTGSGCIPITLSHHWPQSRVCGWDISEEALDVARQNNATQNTHVDFCRKDILQETSGGEDEAPFDLIVSNPPYIKSKERLLMERNVLEWEPHLALFVPDEDPLLFYRSIVRHSAQGLLQRGGWLYFEINREHGAETIALMEEYGFTHTSLLKDISGNERIAKGQLE